MKQWLTVLLVVFFLAFLQGSPAEPKMGACDLCKQIVTAIDEFLTDGSTEQDIIDYVNGVIVLFLFLQIMHCYIPRSVIIYPFLLILFVKPPWQTK